MLFSKKGKNEKSKKNAEYFCIFGDQLSFAAAESYKLLRTNLMLSFTDENNGHVIGISSSIRGEGKSQTAINLSYALAEAGKKVLLMEADLRLTPIAKYLKIAPVPGLSDLLAGLNTVDKTIQSLPSQPGMDVMVAGTVPPNPSELLGSKRMEALIEELAKHYEYIIMDLPPVTAVSDAIVISKLLDGMMVVVRQDYSDSSSLAETIRQLEFANIRILGFVYNFAGDSADSYGRKYKKHYYKKYYKDGYYSNDNSPKVKNTNG